MDLVVANNGSSTVSVLMGFGDGTFDVKSDFGAGSAPSAVAIADFDNDHAPDIAVIESKLTPCTPQAPLRY